jgi:hypothetical protein
MSTSFAVAVYYTCSCSPNRDHSLRRMIISTISRHAAELLKDSKGEQLREIVGTAPAFAIDLVDDLAKIDRGSEATDFDHTARYACSSHTGVFAVASNYARNMRLCYQYCYFHRQLALGSRRAMRKDRKRAGHQQRQGAYEKLWRKSCSYVHKLQLKLVSK